MASTALLLAVLGALAPSPHSQDPSSHSQGPGSRSEGQAPARLAEALSPALLRHADDPVDWWPWGPEAIAEARRTSRPLLLFIGYSACTWCHAMERESFEDPTVAALLAREYVCVAVDRDELPAVDAVYQGGLQLVTGSGGWPVLAFVDPTSMGAFYLSSYLPATPDVNRGVPSFAEVATRLAREWRDNREGLVQYAQRLAAALPELLAPPARADGVPRGLVDRAVEQAMADLDPLFGGFGERSKFPHEGRLLLLERAADDDQQARAAVDHALHAMARSGLFDQLEGGFHRYAGTRDWEVPQFEKLLPTQAQLGALYAEVGAARDSDAFRAVARRTFDFVLDRLEADGRLLSGIDAETGDVVGGTYLWNRAQVERAVGADLAALVAQAFGLDGDPNWTDARDPEARPAWVLRRPAPLAGGRLPEAPDLDPERWEAARARLLAARRARPQPTLDDTTLAGWSGQAAAALARASVLLEEPRYLAAARDALTFVLVSMRDGDGHLHRSYRDGRLGPLAVAEDYILLASGLLEVHRVTEQAAWLDRAVAIYDEGRARFALESGGWTDAARPEFPRLPAIPASIRDGDLPAVNGALLELQLGLAESVDAPDRFLDDAARTAVAHLPRVADEPLGAPFAMLALRHFEARFPDRVPRGEGPVTRVRDRLLEYELRPAERTLDGSGLALDLTLRIEVGYQIAASDPLVAGPTPLS
ncbi:MAG: DUF255 domain-containing protein, partial [Planctomycetota bacterium]